VHHDLRFAQKAGARDIFINILTSGGFVSRYLTDWSGPEGELKRMKFHLGVPCYAGDTLTMTGKVVRKYVDGDQHLVDIEYSFHCPWWESLQRDSDYDSTCQGLLVNINLAF